MFKGKEIDEEGDKVRNVRIWQIPSLNHLNDTESYLLLSDVDVEEFVFLKHNNGQKGTAVLSQLMVIFEFVDRNYISWLNSCKRQDRWSAEVIGGQAHALTDRYDATWLSIAYLVNKAR